MPLTPLKLAAGSGETFGVDDIAIAWAHSGKFWEREGLSISWVPVRGGVAAAQQVLDRNVVAGYGTWLPVVKRAEAGDPLRVLVSMALALAQNLVVNSATVRSPADLKGKRWAVDGIGALSHTLGVLIARGLGLAAEDIEWVVAGPPPERKAHLLDGRADCALMRVEEAVALARDCPGRLSKLLGFEEIRELAPVQPHGVLSVRSDWAGDHPEACRALVRGLILASRQLHDDREAFRRAVRDHVHHVRVTDEDIDSLWQRERDARSFAVNGGFGGEHWQGALAMYESLHGTKPRFGDVSLVTVGEVLREIGLHRSHDPAPVASSL